MNGEYNLELETAKSQKNINWCPRIADSRLVNFYQQKYSISNILATILSSRKVESDEIDSFLNPKLKNILPNPFELVGVEDAVNFVIESINKNKKIIIYADYDVDGATSSAILSRFFNDIGYQVELYIPDRIKEGYGPNINAFQKIRNDGADLVITVDCGAVSFEPLKFAKKIGLDVIVIDHHIGMKENPEAIAVINPNSYDEKFPYKNLCAAGVAFLFIVALNSRLRDGGFYKNINEPINEPNLLNLLDLVALGTICDVMVLDKLNRAFVKLGLKILKARQNIGLKTICDMAGINEVPNSYHLGFIIGPRINAGGRVGKSDLGSKLLSTDDEFEAFRIAEMLENLNESRKKIEISSLEEAVNNIENLNNKFNKNDSVIFAVSYEWHQGVIGLIASRLKDKYYKPVVVITIDKKTGIGKASCRSINGINFGNEIINAKNNGIIIDGGGHAMAGGFSINESKISELHYFFNERLKNKICNLIDNRAEYYDVAIDLSQINIDIINELKKLEPYGVGNPQPKFLIKNLRIVSAKIIGSEQNHISCIFSSKDIFNNIQIKAILFKGVNSELSPILLGEGYNKVFDVIGNISINSWMGIETLQLIIEDIII